MRPCLTCGTPCAGPRCATHIRKYGRPQQSQRPTWDTAITTGTVTCPRCQLPIEPGQPWHLDHYRNQLIPSHRSCNIGAND